VRAAVVTAVLVALLAAAGCGSNASQSSGASKAFCDAANSYENELQREQSSEVRDDAKQLRLVAKIAATAPASIRRDAQTFLDALSRVHQDPRLRDNPAVKRAVDNVNRFASNKCGFFNQQPQGM
jgi:ABC-type sugar transport system substrate-binding protein